jgi:hypothetical protein
VQYAKSVLLSHSQDRVEMIAQVTGLSIAGICSGKEVLGRCRSIPGLLWGKLTLCCVEDQSALADAHLIGQAPMFQKFRYNGFNPEAKSESLS